MSGTGHTTRFVGPSGNQFIDGLLVATGWADSVVEYAFPLSRAEYGYNGEPDTYREVSVNQVTAIQFAIEADGTVADAGFSIEGFTNLTVSFTFDIGAHLRFGATDTSPATNKTTAWTYVPGTDSKAGDVWFYDADNRYDDYRYPQAGNYEWTTHLHEIGHAFGLKHGHNPLLGYGSLPTDYDSMEYSVMTYRSYAGALPDENGEYQYHNAEWDYAQTYMMADIAALQYMYGADFTTNSGDTVYSWSRDSCTTYVNGVAAIEPGGNTIFLTVWDGGGNDTYDMRAYDGPVRIDLRPGSYSRFAIDQLAQLGDGHFAAGNVYNALQYHGDPRSLIENAIGTSHHDTLIGNQAANLLDGGPDYDTADYSHSSARVGVYLDIGQGFGGDAQGDILRNIESLIGTDFSAGDFLTGTDGANSIWANGGNDIVRGLGGDDSLYGGAGDDTMDGGTGGDSLEGGAGNDTMKGGADADTLSGESGDDIVEGGAGADTLDGGDGIDTLSYANSVDGVQVNLSFITPTAIGGDAEGDTFSGFENLIGSNAGDILTGSLLSFNVIAGLGGPDQIDGGGFISTADYSASKWRVGVYLDTGKGLGGDAHGDTLVNIQNLIGSNAADGDFLTGDDADNTLYGMAGGDQIKGGFGNDQLIGGAGADMLDGGADTDTADYSASLDRVGVYLDTGKGLGGDAQGDTFVRIENLIGTRSSYGDYLTGNAADNVIVGLAGPDRIDGKGGWDTADYSASLDRVGVYLNIGRGFGGDAQGDQLTGVENIIGSNGIGGDFLTGNDADNRIEGRAYDDLIAGLGGADLLEGGGGSDTADYSASADRVGVYLNTATGLGGDAHGDLLISIENLIGTNDGAGDFLTGDDYDNVIAGLAGPDRINGMGGYDTADYSASVDRVGVYLNTHVALGGDAQGDVLTSIENLIGSRGGFGDFLTGDAGDNVIAGLAGPDQINGMGGSDTTDYSASTSRVGVYLNTHAALGGDAQGDVLTSIENLIGTNSSLGDYLTGDASDNVIAGLAGPDQINGMGGSDTADYSASNAAVEVDLGTGLGLYGDAQGDFLTNIENLIGTDRTEADQGDNLMGNALPNRIQGLGGDDQIHGFEGEDFLDGGAGDDDLYGGWGADIFYFEGAFGEDEVYSYEKDLDRIFCKDTGVLVDAILTGFPVTTGWSDALLTFDHGEILLHGVYTNDINSVIDDITYI